MRNVPHFVGNQNKNPNELILELVIKFLYSCDSQWRIRTGFWERVSN